MNKEIFLFGFLSLPLVGLIVGMLLGISPILQEEESRPIIGNVRTIEAAKILNLTAKFRDHV